MAKTRLPAIVTRTSSTVQASQIHKYRFNASGVLQLQRYAATEASTMVPRIPIPDPNMAAGIKIYTSTQIPTIAILSGDPAHNARRKA
jgi:hypothetical protein